MSTIPASLESHRVRGETPLFVAGEVRYAPLKSLWFTAMALSAAIGGALTFSWAALALFIVSTAVVLLFGHSLGSHRKLIHGSFACPSWLEYLLVYLGVQVGLSGPLGLLRQHELRDYAQRLPDCHDYLRHGSGLWRDAWWQLHCRLDFTELPMIHIEDRILKDRFYQFLEKTWMAQQLPWAILFYAWGGWGFVFWGVCARVTAGVFGHWLIGYFAHNHGQMHATVQGAAVQGRNIRLTSLLTMGECWHNNHHAFPGSAKLGLFPGEWDPGWWALILLRRCGLVWNVRTADQLPPRPELVPVDAMVLPRPSTMAASGRIPSNTMADLLPLFASLVFGLKTAHDDTCLRWPASLAPHGVLRFLCGPRVDLVLDRCAPRMTLRHAGRDVLGLPALAAAIGQRHTVLGLIALSMLPPMLAIEKLRSMLSS
jgi:stearoyl-CoA desaturase (delta-9 desaturase)